MMVSYTEDFVGDDAKVLMTAWIMAGVISVTSITTCNGAFGIMVEDKALNRFRDFKVSPIKRWQLVLSYILSSMVVALIMTLLTFLLSEIYILIQGGEIISVLGLLKILGYMLLSVFASSSFIFLIMSFINSQNAFGTASSIIGSLIGFFMGIYIPVGNLPNAVQAVIKIFPLSHSAILMRQVLMSEVLDLNYISDEFKIFLGLNFEVNGEFLTNFMHIAYLFISGVVFYLLALIIVSRKRNK